MLETTRKTLSLFVEKAEKLQRLSMVSQLEGGYVKFSSTQENTLIEHKGPNEEAIDAFVLTFRFFIQKNEPISFRTLENLLADPDISENWRRGYQMLREQINEYLDQYPNFGLNIFGTKPTRRDIMNTFIYGSLAHGNDPNYRQTFEKWKSIDMLFPFLEQTFTETLRDILGAITYIANLCREELNTV